MRASSTVRAIRAHRGSHLASAIVALTGTALLTAFACLLQTGLSRTGHGATTLVMLPAILGGWTLAIVTFGVVSTVALTIQHREREIALLRSIAATPGQIRRGVLVETVVVAFPAIVVGLLPGVALGRFVLGRLVATGMVEGPVALVAGGPAFLIGGGTSLVAAVVAALIAARRATAIPPVRALTEAGPVESGSSGRARVVWAAVLLAVGAGLAVTTLFMADGPLLSSTAGPGGVAVAVGLALLAPRLVTVYGALFPARLGATARLAVRNLRARARHTAAVVAPLVLLVGIAAGTLSMQRTEDSVSRGADDAGAKLASVNYLVVAMITAFSAIVVVTTLVAATRRRTREFGLLRLAAITDRQTLKLVTVEATLTTGLAVLLGGVAATATTVPYSLVRTGSPLAAGSVWMFLAVVGGALLLALGAAVPTAARALRTRPIDAVAGGSRGAA